MTTFSSWSSFSYIWFILSILTNIIIISGSNNNNNVLTNGCNGMGDGEYWFLLNDKTRGDDENDDDDVYMPVKLLCSNEHMIIDLSKDINLQDYFSSYEMWHTHLAGPANHDPCNWYEWFLPERSEMNALSSYYISPDCESCDLTNDYQVHDSKTSYWMTGNLAKLRWNVIAFAECDMDWNTYSCLDCQSCFSVNDGCEPEEYDITKTTNYENSGLCGTTIEAADQEVYYSRISAQSSDDSFNYKPSLGTEGEFCVCYQPNTLEHFQLNVKQQQHITARDSSTSMIMMKNGKNMKNMKNMKNVKNVKKDENDVGELEQDLDLRDRNIIYLSQNNFDGGPYRIKESGTYIISEDIIFDFNNNDDYWPRSDQSDDYVGSRSYRDAYHLGFFAGITVESSYVTIDLNGFELKQSIKFYYQQRWFAIIELSNQPFLPGQGPAFFGSNPVIVNDVIIKNGILGLTSHFGIHANFPTNLMIENVHIKDFVTHGLQINGWNNLVMNNIEVGPSSTIEYLRGDYGHARIILQRLGWIEDDMVDDGTIDDRVLFNNHENALSIGNLQDNLREWMEIALDYAMNRATKNDKNNNKFEYNDFVNPNLLDLSENEDLLVWNEIKSQFIQESGFPASSSVTGLFLNFYGASVFSYTKYTTRQSSNGVLNNVYIHDISHEMQESMRLTWEGALVQVYPTPWASDIPAERAFGGYSQLEGFYNVIMDYQNGDITSEEASYTLDTQYQYHGSALTDAYFGMSLFSDSWDYLGFLLTDNRDEDDYSVINWVKGKTYYNDNDYISEIGESVTYTNPLTDWRIGCNQDIMAHAGKGLLGLRVDGVNNLILNDITVENLNEYTGLGSNACGQYSGYNSFIGGGHFHQTTPMQVGFSGNNLQAISIISSVATISGNVKIANLNNDYGQAFGLSFWTANDITLSDNLLINVNNIKAGIKLDQDSNELTYRSLPNQIPEACSVRLQSDSSEDIYESYINNNVYDENDVSNNFADNMISCNVNGFVSCLGSDSEQDETSFTMYGNYHSDASVCGNINSFDDLQAFNNEKQDKIFMIQDKVDMDVNSRYNGLLSNSLVFACLLLVFAVILSMIVLYCNCIDNQGIYGKISNAARKRIDPHQYGSV